MRYWILSYSTQALESWPDIVWEIWPVVVSESIHGCGWERNVIHQYNSFPVETVDCKCVDLKLQKMWRLPFSLLPLLPLVSAQRRPGGQFSTGCPCPAMASAGLVRVFWTLFSIVCSLCSGPGNLPTDTDLVVAVAADPAWLQGQGLNMTELRTILTSALREESWQQQFTTVRECAYLYLSLPCRKRLTDCVWMPV